MLTHFCDKQLKTIFGQLVSRCHDHNHRALLNVDEVLLRIYAAVLSYHFFTP